MASKALAAFSGLGVVLSGVLVVVGIILATKTEPESDCFDGTSLEQEDGAEVSLFLFAVPALVSGLFGLVGSSIGVPGGLKSNRGCIGGALFFWIISAIGLWITVFISSIMATALNHACNDYQCCDVYPTPSCCSSIFSASDTCCTEDGIWTYHMCRANHEFMCDVADVKMVATVAAVLAALAISLLSGFGCGALCCCKASFGFEEGQLKHDPEQPSAVVVGQAVNSQMGKEYLDDVSLVKPDCQA